MSADIIPFPKSPNYLDYCSTPFLRRNARKMFKRFAETMPEREAEHMTLQMVKASILAADRIRRSRDLPPIS